MTVSLPLVKPTGLAVDDGQMVAVGDTALILFAENATSPQRVDLDGKPTAVAAREGKIFVAFADHIEVFTVDGKRSATWPNLDGEPLIVSVSVGPNAVFAGDASNQFVWRMDDQGAVLAKIGADMPPEEDFFIPGAFFDVAADDASGVWAANPGRRRVENWSPDGARVRVWGKGGPRSGSFCGCCNPIHIARIPDGRWVTSEKGIARVSTFSSNGEFIDLVAGPESFAPDEKGLDLATDTNGRVYVLDSSRRQIRIFERKTP